MTVSQRGASSAISSDQETLLDVQQALDTPWSLHNSMERTAERGVGATVTWQQVCTALRLCLQQCHQS
jgi:hypothetical protein